MVAGLVAAVVASSASVASVAGAQVPLVPGALSIAGGLAVPMTGGADIYKSPGVTAEIGYRIGFPLLPFAVRAEAGYTRFSANATQSSIGGFNIRSSGSLSVMSYGAALEMTVLPLILARGYVLASGGYTMAKGDFSVNSAAISSTTQNGFGYGVGAGVELHLPVLPVAGIEARVKYVPSALAGKSGLIYVPITARLTF
jgi:hypothetical protein